MTQTAASPQTAAAFSFAEYAQIIEAYKPLVRDFADAPGADSFCLVRHDIEFSLPRALRMAEIDHQLGIRSTFFVQVRNGAYNPLAPLNQEIIRKIHALSHYVGLHFYVSDIAAGDEAETLRQLKFQSMVLEEALGQPVTRFSYHRPPLWSLRLDLDGKSPLINAYAPAFFELTGNGETPKNIKYMADSQHAWKYGHPLDFRDKYGKFQLLLHPDEWSDAGSSAVQNFRELIDGDRAEFIRTLQTECNHYKPLFPE